MTQVLPDRAKKPRLTVTGDVYEQLEHQLSEALNDKSIKPYLSEGQKDAVWDAFFSGIEEQ